MCEICVEDNSVGISQKNIENLFNISETTTTLGTQNEKGTGLGLILSKEFVKKTAVKLLLKAKLIKEVNFISRYQPLNKVITLTKTYAGYQY